MESNQGKKLGADGKLVWLGRATERVPGEIITSCSLGTGPVLHSYYSVGWAPTSADAQSSLGLLCLQRAGVAGSNMTISKQSGASFPQVPISCVRVAGAAAQGEVDCDCSGDFRRGGAALKVLIFPPGEVPGSSQS
ncbi:bis(5'-adenosyl)-triphosphatase ENPP4 [Platysternon megacephalum]|uniref:Bis(5'-adenosyl)-triphosphatase ENPP4 n=1 Tax=Platysternon megacephalum TaxID=55544 RepID=A0A4D9EEX8_9SAUR|nr:bis(5'-adenosyl)-triphosphatase ENPP4 [Platysternon megacephalum]